MLLALIILFLTPLYNKSFATNIPAVNSCGYYKSIKKEWFADAKPLGFGVYPRLLPSGELQTYEVSIWMEWDGNWAALLSHMVNDPQHGKILWSCIVARGKDWQLNSHLDSGLSL